MASRRGFLNGFLTTVASALGAAVAYPAVRFLDPPRIPEAATSRVQAGTVAELAREGFKLFPFGAEPGILIEVAPGEYRAFSATCTHLECTVQFDRPSSRIWCACHNGWYDLTGRNVAGPPPKPLTPYQVQVVGDEIFVVRG